MARSIRTIKLSFWYDETLHPFWKESGFFGVCCRRWQAWNWISSQRTRRETGANNSHRGKSAQAPEEKLHGTHDLLKLKQLILTVHQHGVLVV